MGGETVKQSTIRELIRYLNALLKPKVVKRQVPGITKPVRIRFGVDGETVPSRSAMKAAGVSFFCGYLSTFGNPKNLTRLQIKTLRAAGVAIVTVFETTATRALDGRGAGRADAILALKQLRALGAPKDAPVYFAIDFELLSDQLVGEYFRGIREILPYKQVGVYGSYNAVRRVLGASLARYGWQTYAWSAGLRLPEAHIYQFSNDHTLGGVSVDFDRAHGGDYGQWRW